MVSSLKGKSSGSILHSPSFQWRKIEALAVGSGSSRSMEESWAGTSRSSAIRCLRSLVTSFTWDFGELDPSLHGFCTSASIALHRPRACSRLITTGRASKAWDGRICWLLLSTCSLRETGCCETSCSASEVFTWSPLSVVLVPESSASSSLFSSITASPVTASLSASSTVYWSPWWCWIDPVGVASNWSRSKDSLVELFLVLRLGLKLNSKKAPWRKKRPGSSGLRSAPLIWAMAS